MLLAAIQRHAAERPDAIAIRHPPPFDEFGRFTWRMLAEDVSAILDHIAGDPELGNQAPIGWFQHNCADAITTLIACAEAGRPHVPLNWRLAEDELRFIEADCGMAAILTDEHSGWDGHPGPWNPYAILHPYLHAAIYGETQAVIGFTGPVTLSFQHGGIIAAPASHPPETPLLIAYTSGTTGRPKGVTLTQGQVAANIAHAQALFGFTPEDRVLAVLPLFHLGGLCIQTLPGLLAGAEIILHARFEPDAVFDSLERDKPTLTLLVPAVMAALVRHPRWAEADISCLRAIGAGSSDVPLHLIAAFHAKGVPVQQVYGMTEAGPIAIAQSVSEAWAHAGSLGFPVGGCAARIGVADEIQLRGPNIFAGYWGDDAATEAAHTADGWFRTGDAGRMDGDGRFWFTGRLTHIIISGGENIAPAEVERVLLTAPGVREGVVIGRPDLRWGEVPVAVIVADATCDDGAVLRHFEGRLARFKHPRAVLRVAALPRTALGKVQLDTVRALTAGG